MAISTDNAESQERIAKLASEKPNIRFAVKVSRVIGGLAGPSIANLSGATGAHLMSPETWLPTLAGGGQYRMTVMDPEAPAHSGAPLAMLTIRGDGAARQLDRKVFGAADWRGPPTLDWPPEGQDADAPPIPMGSAPATSFTVPPVPASRPADGMGAEMAALRAQVAMLDHARQEAVRAAEDARRKADDAERTARQVASDNARDRKHADDLAAVRADQAKATEALREELRRLAVPQKDAASDLIVKMMERDAARAEQERARDEKRRDDERKETMARADRDAAERRDERQREEKRRDDERQRDEKRREDERTREDARIAREEIRLARENADRKELLAKLSEKPSAIEGLQDISKVVSSALSTAASSVQMALDMRNANAPAAQEESTGDLIRALGDAGAKLGIKFSGTTMVPAQAQLPAGKPTPKAPPVAAPEGFKAPPDDKKSPSSQFMAPLFGQIKAGITPIAVAKSLWDMVTPTGNEMTLDQVRLSGWLGRAMPPQDRIMGLFGLAELAPWYQSNEAVNEEYLKRLYTAYHEEAARRGFNLPVDPDPAPDEPSPDDPDTTETEAETAPT